MLGEGSDRDILLGNSLQYDASALNQLQLLGDFTIGCSANPINYTVNEHVSAAVGPIKRARDAEPNYNQKKLRISLNNNCCQDEVGQAGSILNPNPVSTGLRLSYEEERNSSVTSTPQKMKSALPAFLSIDNGVKCEIDRQTEEFDRYIKLQEENMMKGFRELNHRHTLTFLNALENGVNKKLYEKELEIENMNRKNCQLGEKIKQVTMEAQSWHYRAKYNESVVSALKSNIQQLVAVGSAQGKEGCGDSEVDDAASRTDHPDLASSSGDQMSWKLPLNCRACKSKEVSVLLLPCRHLSICKDCEGFIDCCPVCQVMKTASVQVYMS